MNKIQAALFTIDVIATYLAGIAVARHRTWMELCLAFGLLMTFGYFCVGDVFIASGLRNEMPEIFRDPIRPLMVRPFLCAVLVAALCGSRASYTEQFQ